MTDTVDKLTIQSESQGVQQTTSDLQDVSKAMDGVTVAAQKVEQSTGTVDSKFASLERRFGTTAGQAAQYAKVQATVQAAVGQNADLQARGNDVLDAAAAKYLGAAAAESVLTKAHGGLDTQGQALLHSLRSTVEQMVAGVPVTQALSNQINHLTYAASGQGGLSGAFSQVTGLLSDMISPMTVAVGGAVALGGAALYLGNSWDKAREQTELALTGISQKTGTTAADIADFAKSNSSAFGLSITDARNVATEFAKTGEVTISSLHGVGDAVHGYALLTGTDAAQATKAFSDAISGDLFKGIEGLNQRYGALDAATLEYIQTLANQGDKTTALQTFIDATAEANKRAEQSVTGLSAAWQGFKNVISGLVSGPAPTSNLDDQIKQIQAQLQEAQSRSQSGTGISRNSRGELSSQNDFLLQSNDLQKEIDALQAKLDSLNTRKADAQLTDLSKEAFNATNSIFPQIDAMQKLQHQIDLINDAQDEGKAPSHSNEALAVAQQQYDLQQQSLDTTVRQAQAVEAVKEKWGDVSASVAVALERSQNQLPVLEAVGGAQKMAAQYAADYANYMLDGKSATEAAALAGATLADSQAQVNSAAQAQLAALQDQLAVASARNVQEQILAQGQATYNQLLRDGVDSELALAVATQQEADNKAKVYEQNQKAVQASQDQLDLVRAQGTDQEALVKSSIAYRNAIQNGATASQAAAISANTFAAASEQAAAAAQKAAEAWENAARAAHDAQFADITPGGDNSFGFFQTKSGIEGNTAYAVSDLGQLETLQELGLIYGQSTSANDLNLPDTDYFKSLAKRTSDERDALAKATQNALNIKPDYQQIINSAYRSGGIDAAIDAAQRTSSLDPNAYQIVDQLYQFKNAQTTDATIQASNLKGELAWLNSQPESLARDQQITTLNQSIQQLINSTDGLNSTNQALLSPYYDQDPRTSHIGFRSQGMASGGEFTVPGGYSANDNMLAQIPVASGEIVSVRRPGQNLGGTTQNLTINLGGITVNGGTATNANAIGRTVYQVLQQGAKQIAMAGR